MKAKRQWTSREFIRLLKDNGYSHKRTKGDHYIYKNGKKTIIFNFRGLNCMVANRIVKENNLEVKS